MSMQDTTADMLTRIRNAQMAKKVSVTMPHSNTKEAIAKVLLEEGYIADIAKVGEDKKPVLEIKLKYYQGQAVIETIDRISSPGLRVYKGKDEIPTVKKGLGISILSTNKGIMTGKSAHAAGLGGELICTVS